MEGFQDKVFIVTGATSGMGKAIAEKLNEKGAKLILSGRNTDRGKALEQSLGESVFIAGDVAQPEYNQKLVQTALTHFGKLNGLSLNAGILGLGAVTELDISSWQHTMNVNLNALFYISKYAIPELSKTPDSTIVINTSIAAYKSFPNHPAYCASKAAALALMRQMAIEYAPIRINALCPGPVDTPLIWESAQAFPQPEVAVESAAQKTLLGRLGSPEDVAELALFLMSDKASWITGTAMTIDGGILNN
jgi:NAD(P)-dependent dehydrogenase (short-subunit alcohol dehydrogenase family)